MVMLGDAGQPICVISKKGTYTCLETSNAVRVKMPQVDWWNLVWFPMAIHRHAFILWLVIRDSISTGERLLKWGFQGDVMCVFCRSNIEGRDHLFFQCGFDKKNMEGDNEKVFSR
jgi:hypothetical protein